MNPHLNQKSIPSARLRSSAVVATVVALVVGVLAIPTAYAAPGDITTVAGGAPGTNEGDGGLAVDAAVNSPQGLAIAADGDLFVAQTEHVRKIEHDTGIISTIAGNGEVCLEIFDESPTAPCGDGGQALDAPVAPGAMILDASGDLLFADTIINRIRKIDLSTGIITSVVGGGATNLDLGGCGFAGDGGPATSAAVCLPGGLALNADGELLIGDAGNQRVRKVDSEGIIDTIAGSTPCGPDACQAAGSFGGDNGPATAAFLDSPSGLALQGNDLFIADLGNNRIRKVDDAGVITTVAGTDGSCSGSASLCGDGGPATAAQLGVPVHVSFDSAGQLIITGFGSCRIRLVTVAGTISTVVGTGSCGFEGDNGPATAARINGPRTALVDLEGNLLIADTINNRVRQVEAFDDTTTTTTTLDDTTTTTLDDTTTTTLDDTTTTTLDDTTTTTLDDTTTTTLDDTTTTTVDDDDRPRDRDPIQRLRQFFRQLLDFIRELFRSFAASTS